MKNFAGFSCPIDPSNYSDDKALITLVFIALYVAGSYIVLGEVKRLWLRTVLLIVMAIFAFAGWLFASLYFIPWGC